MAPRAGAYRNDGDELGLVNQARTRRMVRLTRTPAAYCEPLNKLLKEAWGSRRTCNEAAC